jgi:hypothetical protein
MNIDAIKVKADDWMKVAEAMIAEEGAFPPMLLGVTEDGMLVNVPTEGLDGVHDAIKDTVASYSFIVVIFILKTGLTGLIFSKTVNLKNIGNGWEVFIPDDVLSNPYTEIISG